MSATKVGGRKCGRCGTFHWRKVPFPVLQPLYVWQFMPPPVPGEPAYICFGCFADERHKVKEYLAKKKAKQESEGAASQPGKESQ